MCAEIESIVGSHRGKHFTTRAMFIQSSIRVGPQTALFFFSICSKIFHRFIFSSKASSFLSMSHWVIISFCFSHLIFIVFSPLPFSPLMPPNPQQSPLCCPCPWVLLPFCSIPLPPNLSPTNCHLLSIYESVPIFRVSSVWPLDSTYEWNHMVFVFLCLAYFT